MLLLESMNTILFIWSSNYCNECRPADASDNVVLIFCLCIEFSSFAALQEEGANVTANALHPGTMDTGFGKNESSVKIITGISLVYRTLLKILSSVIHQMKLRCKVSLT